MNGGLLAVESQVGEEVADDFVDAGEGGRVRRKHKRSPAKRYYSGRARFRGVRSFEVKGRNIPRMK
jgi:hypothetical protein